MAMIRMALGAAVALVSLTTALVQGLPSVPGDGASPVKPRVARLHAKAKVESLADVQAGHRDAVRGIVDAFDAGTIATAGDAAAQIDAVLSPAETRALLADRARMRVALAGDAKPHATADAGRFVLAVNATPDALAQRAYAAPVRPPSAFGI